MWRIVFAALLLVVFALPAFADADEIDNTFRKVNKHLYGIDENAPPEPARDRAPARNQDQPAPDDSYQPPRDDSVPPPRNSQPDADDNAPAPLVSDAVDDEHFIQRDDFFISHEPLGGHSWIWVKLAKMVTPPSAATKKEAEFFQVKDGNKVWLKHYWQTQRASKGALKLGTVVIAFNDNNRDNIYSAPEDKEHARGGSWFMAKITDVSDLFKGYVTVSGNYKVSPDNLRVIK